MYLLAESDSSGLPLRRSRFYAAGKTHERSAPFLRSISPKFRGADVILFFEESAAKRVIRSGSGCSPLETV
jgi:hypothetical protein